VTGACASAGHLGGVQFGVVAGLSQEATVVACFDDWHRFAHINPLAVIRQYIEKLFGAIYSS
jgi:hypothetical protein